MPARQSRARQARHRARSRSYGIYAPLRRGAAGQGGPPLSRPHSQVSLRRHADEGREAGSANYRARSNLRVSLATAAKVFDAQTKGNEAVSPVSPGHHEQPTLLLHRDRARPLGRRKQRADVIAERLNRLVHRRQRPFGLEQLTRDLQRGEDHGFVRFHHSCGHHGSNCPIEVFRDGFCMLGRCIAADGVLLVEDRHPNRMLLGAQRSPPWACCLRNRTRSRICLARVVAESSLVCKRSLSCSSWFTRSANSRFATPPSCDSTSLRRASAIKARRRKVARSSARCRTSKSSSCMRRRSACALSDIEFVSECTQDVGTASFDLPVP